METAKKIKMGKYPLGMVPIYHVAFSGERVSDCGLPRIYGRGR
jgi:hypothetical protein